MEDCMNGELRERLEKLPFEEKKRRFDELDRKHNPRNARPLDGVNTPEAIPLEELEEYYILRELLGFGPHFEVPRP